MAYIREAKKTKKMTSVFSGLDKRERIQDGAFGDMLNMTASKYPCAASRNGRTTQLFTETVTENGGAVTKRASSGYKIYAAESEDGEIGWLEYGREGAVTYIRYRNSNGITDKIKGVLSFPFASSFSPSYGGIVRSGRDVFIYPEALHTDYGADETGKKLYFVKKEASLTPGFCTFTVVPTDADGASITVVSAASAPSSPSNGAYWYDTENKGLYRYSAQSSEWVAWSAVCFRVTASTASDAAAAGLDTAKGFFSGFNEGDAVEAAFLGETANMHDSSHIVQSVSEDGKSIVLNGFADGFSTLKDGFIRRKAPFLQYAVSWRNRIWGCCYGEYDGQFVNEIYGSALGDMNNFFKYEGTAADSFTASVGSYR